MPNQSPKFFPMNTAEVLDKAVDVYKKSFLKQLAYSAIVQIISFILIFIVSFATIMTFAFTTANAFATGAAMGGGIVFSIALIILLFLLLVFLWQAFASAGHILLAKQALYGEQVKINVGELPGTAMRIITSLIAQLIVSLPFLVAGGVMFLFLLLYDENLGGVPFGMVMAVIVVLVLAYWIFANIFALSIAVAVYEKKYFFSTISRSWQLVKEEFWKILAVRTLWILVVLVVTASLQGAFGLISSFVDIFFGTTFVGMVAGGLMVLATWGVNIALSFATAPLEGILQATIYFNQRVKKEGLDIEITLDGLNHVV